MQWPPRLTTAAPRLTTAARRLTFRAQSQAHPVWRHEFAQPVTVGRASPRHKARQLLVPQANTVDESHALAASPQVSEQTPPWVQSCTSSPHDWSPLHDTSHAYSPAQFKTSEVHDFSPAQLTAQGMFDGQSKATPEQESFSLQSMLHTLPMQLLHTDGQELRPCKGDGLSHPTAPELPPIARPPVPGAPPVMTPPMLAPPVVGLPLIPIVPPVAAVPPSAETPPTEPAPATPKPPNAALPPAGEEPPLMVLSGSENVPTPADAEVGIPPRGPGAPPAAPTDDSPETG